MNRGKKLVGIVEKSPIPHQKIVYSSSTKKWKCRKLVKHKKWHRGRRSKHRLNGVDIDDFIIEFADNHKTNNIIEESDNMLENNSLNLGY